MIHLSPYDTGAGCSLPVDKIRSELERVALGSYLNRVNIGAAFTGHPIEFYLIEGGNAVVDAIPFYDHPLDFNTNSVCTDVRLFGRFNVQSRKFNVRDTGEYTLAIKRTVLSKLWLSGCQVHIRDLSLIPLQLYASMLSETIARRFTLNPAEQAKVAVYAAYFYLSLFTDIPFSGLSQERMLMSISKATYVKMEIVKDYLTGVKQPATLESFILLVRENINNEALNNLTYATLLAITCGLWIGTKARDVSAVALEHPPTWIVMTEAALRSRTYKRSSLAKMAMRFGKQGTDDAFSKAINSLIAAPKLQTTLAGFVLEQ